MTPPTVVLVTGTDYACYGAAWHPDPVDVEALRDEFRALFPPPIKVPKIPQHHRSGGPQIVTISLTPLPVVVPAEPPEEPTEEMKAEAKRQWDAYHQADRNRQTECARIISELIPEYRHEDSEWHFPAWLVKHKGFRWLKVWEALRCTHLEEVEVKR